MLHLRRKKVGKGGEREKIKIIVLFHSYPTRKNKLKKNRKNIQKIKNILLWLHFWPKFVEKGRDREKIKIIVPFRSYHTRNRNSKKIAKKIQKIEKYHYDFISRQNRLERAKKERK